MSVKTCPNCLKEKLSSGSRLEVVRCGGFYRVSDRRWIQKFRCLGCNRHFSHATHHACFRQNKRQLNFRISQLLSSGVSQRRIAKLLKISRTTVARKLVFLGAQAALEFKQEGKLKPKSETIEFDDLETFEHTKFKPLSITLAVEHRTRRILGFRVAKMPAKGLLTKRAIKKYGRRLDERSRERARLFSDLTELVLPTAVIKSDENPHYPKIVKKHFPSARHEVFKGQRGSIVGQGELKKVRFDPLFSLNHTCAMFRANVNRLFRRTWCTTKNPERLIAHLHIYANYHNKWLIQGN